MALISLRKLRSQPQTQAGNSRVQNRIGKSSVAAVGANAKRFMAATIGRDAKTLCWIRSVTPPRFAPSLLPRTARDKASAAKSCELAKTLREPRALRATKWAQL